MKVITGKDLQGHVLLQLVWVKILAHVKEVSPPKSMAADYSSAESVLSFTS